MLKRWLLLLLVLLLPLALLELLLLQDYQPPGQLNPGGFK